MKLVSLTLGLCVLVMTDLRAQTVTPNQDGSLFSIETGNLRLEVDSAFGAKVSSLTLDGYEFMVTAEMVSTDYLWGATLWPSPQQEWNWNNPDKLVWDNGPYNVSIEADTMIFSGPEVSVDNGDRFYFIKRFWANPEDTSFSQHYFMVNTSGKIIKKALWELTRVPVGGLTFWPTGPAGTWGDLAPATEEAIGHTWYEREDEDGTGLKFFADGSDGWFAHVDDFGRLYVKTFDDVDRSSFAAGEGEIELWVDAEYIELENQSACEYLDNGARLEYEVRWYLCQLPDSIEISVGNQDLVDYVERLIGRGETPTVSPAGAGIENLRIHPNPAGSRIHVSPDLLHSGSLPYIITDIRGNVVMAGELDSETLDVSGLRQGLYLVRIGNGRKQFSSRVLIGY